jgi:hypothetical protein
MASEILAVPEEDLEVFIRIVRAGIRQECLERNRVGKALEEWCAEEEAYLKGLQEP